MKLIQFCIAILLTTLPVCIQAELILLDKIECVVCGPTNNTPLVDTDVSWKRSLDGQPVPLQQQLQQEIMNQQVVADKMPIDLSIADKYVESLKKQNNLNDNDLKELFAQVGRTFSEGISLLSNQYMQEVFTHYKFKSQLIPTEDDIAKYYHDHPEYDAGWCEVQVAHVEYGTQEKSQLRQKLDATVDGNNSASKIDIEWSSPVKLYLDDIAEDKQFITAMNVGQTIIKEEKDSYELYKLVAKQDTKLKSLDACRSLITDRLNRNKFQTMLENYNKEVKKFVDIINLNDYIMVQD